MKEMRGAMTQFNVIFGAVKVFKDRVNNALLVYRRDSATVREVARVYKDEQEYIDKHLPELKADARRDIRNAREKLNKDLEDGRKALEKQLTEIITAVPGAVFLERMRVFHDFGITPNRIEINSLLNLSGGNHLGVRALNAVLEKTGAKYRVSPSPYEAFSDDLDNLTRLQRTVWFGSSEYSKEISELFSGQPRTFYKPDGTPYQSGEKWESLSLTLQSHSFNELVKSLEKSSEAWAAEVLPVIVENEETGKLEEKPHDLPPVTQIDDSAEAHGEMAREMGRKTADGAALAKQVLDIYSR